MNYAWVINLAAFIAVSKLVLTTLASLSTYDKPKTPSYFKVFKFYVFFTKPTGTSLTSDSLKNNVSVPTSNFVTLTGLS